MAETQSFPCQVQLGFRTISGTARLIGAEFPHVLRFHAEPTVLDNCVRWLASWLPAPAQSWLQAWTPSFFLPRIVILKTLKPGWDAEFDHEKKLYQQLKPIQGRAIPVWYGEGTCDGRRAMVLSDVGGANLYAEQFRLLDETAFKEKLQPAIRAMLELGVEPADSNPRNYHLVGDSAFIIDLEDTVEAVPERVEELADAVADAVAHWAAFYHRNNGPRSAPV